MESIIEHLEKEIPEGRGCHGFTKNSENAAWCKYHEIKKPTLSENGSIQSYYCNLQEEFVNRKMCGINE